MPGTRDPRLATPRLYAYPTPYVRIVPPEEQDPRAHTAIARDRPNLAASRRPDRQELPSGRPGARDLRGPTTAARRYRSSLIELAREDELDVVVGRPNVDELQRADYIMLTSTAGGAMPVATLDGTPVRATQRGRITLRLRERYWAAHDDPPYTTLVDSRDSAAP